MARDPRVDRRALVAPSRASDDGGILHHLARERAHVRVRRRGVERGVVIERARDLQRGRPSVGHRARRRMTKERMVQLQRGEDALVRRVWRLLGAHRDDDRGRGRRFHVLDVVEGDAGGDFVDASQERHVDGFADGELVEGAV